MFTKQRSARIIHAAIAALLACTLACVPSAALAEDETANAETTNAATAPSATSPHGLYAAIPETVHSNEATVSTNANKACGVYAEAGATIIANALSVLTTGTNAAAIATSADGGTVSIANAQLSTTGTDAPLLQVSSGTVEADHVSGNAERSQIARVEDAGRLVVNSSSLTSQATTAGNGEAIASAITVFSAKSSNAMTDPSGKAALFQASNTTLQSAITSGAFFRLANTTANIVLFNNVIAFDEDKAKLLVAAGSDATSGLVSTTKDASHAYGTAGKNGVTATFTALNQKLSGDIEVDSISSVDFFLLDGSAWVGSSNIISNSAGSDVATNITVNIDAGSSWIVTKNSTVSQLNIAKGGKLVDNRGKAVTIVDADGNKLVDGASDVEVSVTNEFSTTVKTSDVNKLQAATVDRAAFDAEFDTSTAFGTNGTVALSDEEIVANLQAIIVEWFDSL